MTELDRLAGMVLDPEMTGDMLAVGAVLYTALGGGIRTSSLSVGTLNRMAFPNFPRAWDQRHTKAARVIARDARRYVPADPTGRCRAPMIRRDGPCGQSATTMQRLTDGTTGQRWYLEACTRHRGWYREQVRHHAAIEPQVGTPPIPPANSGGVLRRHLPEFDWEAMWAALDPTWQRHPEPDDETRQDTTGGLTLVVSNTDREREPSTSPSVPLAAVPNTPQRS